MPPIPPRPCWASWARLLTENGGYGHHLSQPPGWPWDAALIPLGLAWSILDCQPPPPCSSMCTAGVGVGVVAHGPPHERRLEHHVPRWHRRHEWLLRDEWLSSPKMSIPNSLDILVRTRTRSIKTYDYIIAFELKRLWFVTFAAEYWVSRHW